MGYVRFVKIDLFQKQKVRLKIQTYFCRLLTTKPESSLYRRQSFNDEIRTIECFVVFVDTSHHFSR